MTIQVQCPVAKGLRPTKHMPAPVLTKEQWDEVEKAYILGVSATELGRVFGVEPNTIHQKAWEKEWLSPRKVQKMKEEYQIAKSNGEQGLSESKEGSKALEIVAETVAEYAQKGQLTVLKGLMPWLDKTFSSENPLLNTAATSMKDAATGANLFAKFSLLDKPQTAVSLNFWGGPGQSSAPVWEVPTDVDGAQDDSERLLP